VMWLMVSLGTPLWAVPVLILASVVITYALMSFDNWLSRRFR
jgi:hypothetical protein